MNRLEITEAGPHPLGERVQRIQANEGGNSCTIAERISFEEADPASLPKVIQAKQRAITQKLEAVAKDRAEMDGEIREVARQNALYAGRPLAQQKLAALLNFSAICNQDVTEFQTSLDDTDISTHAGWSAALNRANSACIAEKLIKVLPRKIDQANQELKDIDAEIAALEAKFQ